MRIRALISLIFALLLGHLANARTVYVKDYRLEKAISGDERFELIRAAHEKAVKIGAVISYKGLSRLDIEIPRGAKSIPLPFETDFASVEIVVKNTEVPNFSLFVLSHELNKVTVMKGQISSGKYKDVPELRRGKKILVIEDETPWVTNRKGYSYGAARRDILYLRNGTAQGNVVATYNNPQSSPKCYYRDVRGQKTRIRNLIFTRTSDSEQITTLFGIKNQNDVAIENITINTPESDLYGDSAIGIQNVTNLKMSDVTINGTYSQEKKFGYGISMNNVWNVRFTRLNADGKWGVFGTNNVNFVIIEDSDINRFDIHCYGRDVFCYRTTFRNLYNQFSSIYGKVVFEGCEFIDFIPVLFEYSYAAYTPFDLVLRNCKIVAKGSHPYLIAAGNAVASPDGAREELSETSWPNVTIEDVEVTLPPGQRDWMLFKLSSKPTVSVKNISYVNANGLKINGYASDGTVKFSNYTIQTEDKISSIVTKSSINNIEF